MRWRWSARHSAALGTTPHWTAPDVVQAPTIPAELYQPVIVTDSAGVTPDRWWSLDTNGARLGSQTRQPHLMAALYPLVGVGRACPQSGHRMVSLVRSTKSWMLGGHCVHGGALVLGRRPGLPYESAPIYPHVLWCIAMKRKLVKIGEASRLLGTSPAQLRKWDVSGDLRPARRTRGGTRYYAVADLVSTAPGVVADGPTTICYAWVSGIGQEVELDRQEALMAAYCIGQGWSTWVVLDHGAGPELRELVELVLYRQVERLVVADGVDLPAFGRALLTTICEAQGVEVVVAQPVDRRVVIEHCRTSCWQSLSPRVLPGRGSRRCWAD